MCHVITILGHVVAVRCCMVTVLDVVWSLFAGVVFDVSEHRVAGRHPRAVVRSLRAFNVSEVLRRVAA